MAGAEKSRGVTGRMEYCAKISVEEGKLAGILKRLEDAHDEIYKCYSELEELGVLEIKKPAEATDGPAA